MQKQQQAPKLEDIYAKKSEIETIVVSVLPNYTTQGPKGDKGEQGLQGPAGRDGSNGRDGVDGHDNQEYQEIITHLEQTNSESFGWTLTKDPLLNRVTAHKVEEVTNLS